MADRREPWDSPKSPSWIPRILAPLALVAVVVAVIVIVNSSVGGDSGGGATETAVTSEQKGEIPRTYVVEAGDSLSTIAEKFDISVERIERLNPDIDPATLNEGDELKLH
jgi:LysM repeat protein